MKEKLRKILNNKNLLLTILIVLLFMISVSFALYNIVLEGQREHSISTNKLSFSYKEPLEALDLISDGPLSDDEGKIQNNYYEFTISASSSEAEVIDYVIYLQSEFSENSFSPSDLKVYLTRVTKDGESKAINPTLLSNLEQFNDMENTSALYGTKFTFTNTNLKDKSTTYRLRIWIKEGSTVGTGEITHTTVDGEQHFTSSPLEYKFKVNVSTGVMINQNLDQSGANEPVLASNMIPVYYDGTNWVKADSENRDPAYKWYDYNDKMWANAVTVTSTNRQTYLDADPGTPISMDDINTMLVWIPRFVASKNTVDCATVKNPNIVDHFACYDRVIDFSEKELDNYITYLLFNFYDDLTVEKIATEKLELIETISNYDYETLDVFIVFFGLEASKLKYFSEYITITDLDKAQFINNMEDKELAQVIIDYGFNCYILDNLIENSNEITSDIYIPIGDEMFSYMCTNEGKDCNKLINDFNQNELLTKYDLLSEFYDNGYILRYIFTQSMTTFYKFNFDKTNIDLLEYFPNNGGMHAKYPGAFNITFVDKQNKAHDTFTFGSQNLSGMWVGKFENSSDTTCTATDYSAVGSGCNLNTIRPKVIPNATSWRGAMVSTIFYDILAMTESGNQYGFDKTKDTTLDTHMLKNNEWGAVAYLTQSIYGRCSSSTSCTEVGINNNSSYITGYGAPAGSDTLVTNGTYETTLGMDASTTGNIYGVYDMSGGAYEYVMGVYTDGSKLWSGDSTDYNSGFNGWLYSDGQNYSAGVAYPSDDKYYNLYTTESDYTSSGLHHALTETSGWYGDNAGFVNSYFPWFHRGGSYSSTGYAGVFGCSSGTGGSLTNYGSRFSATIN